jgi:hypothetical protein
LNLSENQPIKEELFEKKEEKEILAEIPQKTQKTNPIKKFINWVNNLF